MVLHFSVKLDRKSYHKRGFGFKQQKYSDK